MHGSSLEVADIFRAVTPEACFQHDGTVWRAENAPSHRLQANDCRAMGHISLTQLKVMSSIERCRTAALGGHVARCEDCAHEHIAYNSCRNHCPAGDCAAICREGALPKMSGWCSQDMAGGARGRTVARAVFSLGLHTAQADRRYSTSEQTRDLQSIDARQRGHGDQDRRRPQAPWCACGHDFGIAHLGLGDDAPPITRQWFALQTMRGPMSI